MGFKFLSKRGAVKATGHGILSLWGSKSKKTSKAAKQVLGGKYLLPNNGNSESLDGSNSDASTAKTLSWKSCNSLDYKERRRQLAMEDQTAAWGKAFVDSQRLPRVAHFANNHIMINTERTRRAVPALKRSSELDAIARWHAENMASADTVHHSDAAELQSKLGKPCEFLGENVAKGENIRSIHKEMMKNVGDVYNMTDRNYSEMGMATARGPNGDLYLCQIFRG
jgi:uncharacterized protein YkwD